MASIGWHSTIAQLERTVKLQRGDYWLSGPHDSGVGSTNKIVLRPDGFTVRPDECIIKPLLTVSLAVLMPCRANRQNI
jgi:hypothetical protein